MGGGGPSGESQSYPVKMTWRDILPPWVQAGQQEFMPYLFERAYQGGMSPEEEQLLTGMARTEVGASVNASKGALGQRMAQSGLSPSSPIFAGAYGDIEAGRSTSMAQALANLQKVKMGAGESARQQLMTALYTPPPFAVGQQSSSTQSSGGGK